MVTKTRLISLWQLLGEAIRGKEQDYTSGDLNRAIFLLSVPMILEMSMESLFAVVDVFFVSRLGVYAVATVGLTEAVLTVVYSLAWGLSIGTTAMVSRRVGEKKIDDATVVGVQALYLALGFAILISLIGLFSAEGLLALMGSPPDAIKAGVGYTRWMLGGNFTIMLIFVINAIFRGAGDAVLAMRALWLANILNILLDPVLIFGLGPIPAFGIQGAAIATNIGRGVGVCFQLYHLIRGSGIVKVHKGNLGLHWHPIRRLIQVSAGGTGQFIIGSASWIFLMRVMAVFGSVALAGYTIAIRVIIFTILPSWGMANAAATLVGQNLGAGNPDRAERAVWKAAYYNMLFLGGIAVVFLLGARFLLSPFSTDEAVLSVGIKCLRFISAGYILFGYGMVIGQAFNGAGDTRTPTLLNLFGFWVLQIPLAWLLAVTLGLETTGVFLAITIAESALAVVSILFFRRGGWKTVKL